jgi:hypothetical protein
VAQVDAGEETGEGAEGQAAPATLRPFERSTRRQADLSSRECDRRQDGEWRDQDQVATVGLEVLDGDRGGADPEPADGQSREWIGCARSGCARSWSAESPDQRERHEREQERRLTHEARRCQTLAVDGNVQAQAADVPERVAAADRARGLEQTRAHDLPVRQHERESDGCRDGEARKTEREWCAEPTHQPFGRRSTFPDELEPPPDQGHQHQGSGRDLGEHGRREGDAAGRRPGQALARGHQRQQRGRERQQLEGLREADPVVREHEVARAAEEQRQSRRARVA